MMKTWKTPMWFFHFLLNNLLISKQRAELITNYFSNSGKRLYFIVQQNAVVPKQELLKQELLDFSTYWHESMINPDNNEPRPPGGASHTDEFGVAGVDYQNQLIPWCKGNSVSVDQTTLQLYRNLFSALIENYKSRIRLIDMTPGWLKADRSVGITAKDIELNYGKPTTKGTRKHAVGETTTDWKNAEFLFINLLVGGHINLYSSDDTLSTEQSRIINDIQRGRASEPNWMGRGICQELTKTDGDGGHIRLNQQFGWETYIRDHYGAPSGVPGVIPGSLRSDIRIPKQSNQTMPLPLHIALSETMARAHGHGNNEDPWGKNQTNIRRQIADKALDGIGDRIPLDEYYIIFARNNAGHMADSFFHRSISDKSAARYELVECVDSKPKKWEVKLEPEFLRWRELQRQRERKNP